MAFGITVEKSGSLDGAAKFEERVNSVGMSTAIGRGAQQYLLAFFGEFDGSRPNRLGGKRTHYFARVAKSTSYEAKPGEVTVSVNEVGIRQRIKGGPIEAQRSKYLTIPAIAEAYGRRASEFNNLVVAYGKKGPYALQEAQATNIKFGGKRKDGTRGVKSERVGGRVFYWLVPRVVQDPDPTLEPNEADLWEAGQLAAEEYMATFAGGAN